MKLATISVTVAAGCHVTVPHPSGIRELPGKVLSGGAVFSVSPDTAADLWAARLILNPQTGELPEPSPAAPKLYEPPGATVSIGGAPRARAGLNMVDQGIDWRAYAEPSTSEDRAPKPPPHNCAGPTIDRTAAPGEWRW